MRKGMRQARATFGRVVGRRLFIISAVLAIAMTALFAGAYRERLAAAAPQQPAGAVNFHPAQIVKEAPVLDGDPSDGRCPKKDLHCFKDNKDFLNGQRSMLGIEDFGIAARTRNSGAADDYYVGGIATTANSGITSVRASSLTGSVSVGTDSAPATIGARLFNGGQEALVSAIALKSGALSIVANLGSGGGVGGAATGCHRTAASNRC